jgi:DNA (cytosine-5)-methyltransferase 1
MSDGTHASFFSGVGGLDLGLERAGWRTISFSEIDPYASSVLARHWPDVPNLGDITDLASRRRGEQLRQHPGGRDWRHATLWSGGFPCQDLSIAGKRAGLAGARSGLAFAFLDLVEQYRPVAILLENVPGLLSSHRGRDMAALLGRMVELGYGVAYRVLDAQYFGVPQRRRRVFILALRSGPDDPDGRVAAERAATVLSVGARCPRHPAKGVKAGSAPASGVVVGALSTGLGHHGAAWGDEEVGAGHVLAHAHIANGLRASDGHHGYASLRGDGGDNPISSSPDPGRVRASDGLAGRMDDHRLAATLNSGGNSGGFRTEPGEHLTLGDSVTADDPLLPLGLDSHRYRCCGNGVVAPVAEWIGRQLLAALDALEEVLVEGLEP